ncbi:hypothetical protein BaRGS_00008021 [Batillaria attramentaria]|uniref:Uncharacterized protein n=1 Tax=Batillaria attramentaria TaxID=370345 RepID=A0ABD0LMG2_9CAEN
MHIKTKTEEVTSTASKNTFELFLGLQQPVVSLEIRGSRLARRVPPLKTGRMYVGHAGEAIICLGSQIGAFLFEDVMVLIMFRLRSSPSK